MKINLNVYVKEIECVEKVMKVINENKVDNMCVCLNNKECNEYYWNVYGDIEYDVMNEMMMIFDEYDVKNCMYDF